MKLTDTNITELYKFTRKHYVEHYDVQTELVDHLANDIEAIWEENPNLSFEKARDKSFKKFGVFGFMNVVEEKQKQLQKKYLKVILYFVKEWFKLPKLILTFLLIYVFYILQKIPNSYTIFVSIYIIIFTVELVIMFKTKISFNKKVKCTGKRWMLEDIIETQGYGNILFFSYYLFYFTLPKDFDKLSMLRSLFIAFGLTITIIVGYISLILIPKKSKKILEEQYPEYKLV
ncbi:hypothetical protein [Tenacibaculum geojense]|uniref:Uncharacterized protein n=1 Tax=Tenacibaculum geojense TaxID=915352 RepID=A0ABW3JS33_9FLAO